MGRVFTRFVQGLTAIVLFCVLVLVATRVASVYTRSRQKLLLNKIASLHVGTSRIQDVQAITQRFPTEAGARSSACPSADHSYSFRVANDTLNRLAMRLPELRFLGVRPAGVVAVVLLRDGVVCFVSFDVATMLQDGNREVEATTSVESVRDTYFLRDHQYHVLMNSIRGYIHTLDVRISPSVNDERRAHAFDYDLSCLGSFRGCRAPCELMPSAWLDYQKEARANGWDVPPEDASDPHCTKLADARH